MADINQTVDATNKKLRGTTMSEEDIATNAAQGGMTPEQYKAANQASINPQNNLKDTTAAMSPGVAQAAQGVSALGGMTQEQIANRSMGGVDQSGQLPNAQTQQQQIQGLGGNPDQGMQDAIANRQSKLYGSHLNNLSQQAKMGAAGIQARQQNMAMKGMASVEDLKTQAANTQLVKYQNDVAKRNSLLNSILGIFGTAVGGVAGGLLGGTQGAQAGAQLGSSAAKGIGMMGEAQGGNTTVRGLDSGGSGSANYFGGG